MDMFETKRLVFVTPGIVPISPYRTPLPPPGRHVSRPLGSRVRGCEGYSPGPGPDGTKFFLVSCCNWSFLLWLPHETQRQKGALTVRSMWTPFAGARPSYIQPQAHGCCRGAYNRTVRRAVEGAVGGKLMSLAGHWKTIWRPSLVGWRPSLLGAKGIATSPERSDATNSCLTTRNKCIATTNKKLKLSKTSRSNMTHRC